MQHVAYHFSKHARCGIRHCLCWLPAGRPRLQERLCSWQASNLQSVAPRSNASSTTPLAKLVLGQIMAKTRSDQLHENLASHSVPLAPLPECVFVEGSDCLL